MTSLHHQLDTRSRSGRGAHPSLWLGIIVNVTPSSVWVRVPQLAQDDIAATNTITSDLAPGDRVVVGLMEGRVDNLVVLAKEKPTVPAHVHAETDVRYPGWAAATLTATWAGVTPTDYFSGLRYRTDSRSLHISGHVSGGAAGSVVATLPVTIAYQQSVLVPNDTGAPVQLIVKKTGDVVASAVGPLLITAVVPRT